MAYNYGECSTRKTLDHRHLHAQTSLTKRFQMEHKLPVQGCDRQGLLPVPAVCCAEIIVFCAQGWAPFSSYCTCMRQDLIHCTLLWGRRHLFRYSCHRLSLLGSADVKEACDWVHAPPCVLLPVQSSNPCEGLRWPQGCALASWIELQPHFRRQHQIQLHSSSIPNCIHIPEAFLTNTIHTNVSQDINPIIQIQSPVMLCNQEL